LSVEPTGLREGHLLRRESGEKVKQHKRDKDKIMSEMERKARQCARRSSQFENFPNIIFNL